MKRGHSGAACSKQRQWSADSARLHHVILTVAEAEKAGRVLCAQKQERRERRRQQRRRDIARHDADGHLLHAQARAVLRDSARSKA